MVARCPRCDSIETIRKGFSISGKIRKQVYLCKECKRRFFVGSKGRYHDRFRVRTINMYTMGSTIDEIQKEMRRRFKKQISKTTIHRWILAYSHLAPMKKSRMRNANQIVKKEMVHRGLIYRYSYHLIKLEYAKREFPELTKYLTSIEDRPEYQEGERCSSLPVRTKVNIDQKNNLACKMASFALNEANNNKERHEVIENFMLINDTATIAKEVPIYFWEKGRGSITGHIDILQIRYGKIHILDYKPNAIKENASGQLLLYARGLSFRTGIPLDRFECAWFDDRDYLSFSPTETKWDFK